MRSFTGTPRFLKVCRAPVGRMKLAMRFSGMNTTSPGCSALGWRPSSRSRAFSGRFQSVCQKKP